MAPVGSLLADFIFVDALTLFGNKPADSKVLYYKFLRKHYPKLLSKYKSLYKISTYTSKNIKKSLQKKQERYASNTRLIIESFKGHPQNKIRDRFKKI